MSCLIVENLTVAYGDIQAVKGISFEVRQGEIFTLIGANGAGKTSTLQAISNLLPHSGKVSFEGRDLRGIAADQLVSMGIA
ncbi:MAG: ATP-binding cassette domain-containing protein, partial [Verrucomicrobia bacterium]|nr:ATP-binding cassette domain-containing protein [Verrucomicrobiota bacterium]